MGPFLTDTGCEFRGVEACRTAGFFESARSDVTGAHGCLRVCGGMQVCNTRGCYGQAEGVERDGRGLAINQDSPPRSKDDSLAKVRGAATTFADVGRQDLGLQISGCWSVFPGRGLPAFYGHLSEEYSTNSFMTRAVQLASGGTHVRQLMESGLKGRKASVDTTKNDNIEKRLYRL